MDQIQKQIDNIEQYLATMNNRITVIESIINEENSKMILKTVTDLKRVVTGDENLGVPPIMEQIKSIIDFHDNIKAIIVGLVVFDVIALITTAITILAT